MDWARFTGYELDALQAWRGRQRIGSIHGQTHKGLLTKLAIERVSAGVYQLTALGRTVRAAASLAFDQGRAQGRCELIREQLAAAEDSAA